MFLKNIQQTSANQKGQSLVVHNVVVVVVVVVVAVVVVGGLVMVMFISSKQLEILKKITTHPRLEMYFHLVWRCSSYDTSALANFSLPAAPLPRTSFTRAASR